MDNFIQPLIEKYSGSPFGQRFTINDKFNVLTYHVDFIILISETCENLVKMNWFERVQGLSNNCFKAILNISNYRKSWYVYYYTLCELITRNMRRNLLCLLHLLSMTVKQLTQSLTHVLIGFGNV